MNLAWKNTILLLIVIVLVIIPFVIQKEAEFTGADSLAEETISEVNPEYKPWFSALWEPPSDEVESFLFAAQAAIGSGVVCYYLGYLKGRKDREGNRERP